MIPWLQLIWEENQLEKETQDISKRLGSVSYNPNIPHV